MNGSLYCVLLILGAILSPATAEECAMAKKTSAVADAIVAIETVGGSYSFRPPKKNHVAAIEGLGYDPRNYWKIRRVTLGPKSGHNGPPVTDATLVNLHDHFLALRTITLLDLTATEVSNAGLAKMPPLLNLRVLRLSNTRIGDGLFRILSRFPALEELEIAESDYSAAEYQRIVKAFF